MNFQVNEITSTTVPKKITPQTTALPTQVVNLPEIEETHENIEREMNEPFAEIQEEETAPDEPVKRSCTTGFLGRIKQRGGPVIENKTGKEVPAKSNAVKYGLYGIMGITLLAKLF